MRQTIVLVLIGGVSAGVLATGLAVSSLILDGLGAAGIVVCAIGLLHHGLRVSLDWFVSKTT
jgi:hypothetical protein